MATPPPTLRDRSAPRAPADYRQTVPIPAGEATIFGDLSRPEGPRGLVLFAHGSGSGRGSPRNRAVARALNASGLATLLVDLLTEAEARVDQVTNAHRFDIPRLTGRVLAAVDWAAGEPRLAELPCGVYGASTGGAVALLAAAARPARVSALVLRGARTDLAGPAVSRVVAPTLIIVGGNDPEILELNEATLRELRGEKRLAVVPGATHLFEEAGALEEVSRLTVEWFARFLSARGRGDSARGVRE